MTIQAALPDTDDHAAAARIEPRQFRPPATGPGVPRPRIPWLAALAFGVIAIMIWAAWFVLTARSVALIAQPDTASINVHEWPAPRVGNHWLLRAGPRHVRVEAPGYISFDDVIEIGVAQLQSHTITLVPLPGHLRVTITPPVSAEILVDGNVLGDVPGLIHDVPAGTHDIEIRAPRYLPFAATFAIEGKGIEQDLRVTLDPAWADVRIDSRPHGASVRVDNQDVGRTPLTTELLNGRRVVELVAPGYKVWKQTLKVTPGHAVDLGEVVLSKADGRVAVRSTPSAANVTVDGEFHGLTPVEIAVTPDRAHTIGLLKEGYKGREQSLSVASGQLENLDLTLEPELATIRFETTPADAELLVNGQPSGSATQTISLPTHEHEITVRARGYATYQTRITPRKGVEKRFRIRLKTAAEAQAATTSGSAPAAPRASPTTRSGGSIKTFAGQEMKLFTGGRAELGSSRGSPGHSANEVLREVALERPFYLALKEVTNADYRAFLAAHQSGDFNGQTLDQDLQAVSNVSWEASALYCNWLSRRDNLPLFYQIKYGEVLGINPAATGYRLPTEAEWEWAARWPPKGEPTVFPWGAKYPPQGRSGNYADSAAASIMGETISGYSDGYAVTAPVGSYAPNLKGLYDMDGNVAEWVHDFYDAAPPARLSVDPLGPTTGTQRVIKGASWAQGSITALRLSYRDFGDKARDDVGFRLARYAQ